MKRRERKGKRREKRREKRAKKERKTGSFFFEPSRYQIHHATRVKILLPSLVHHCHHWANTAKSVASTYAPLCCAACLFVGSDMLRIRWLALRLGAQCSPIVVRTPFVGYLVRIGDVKVP
jgi:hypothetical protein